MISLAHLSAAKVDEPVADPLGLKEVDLRVFQKTLVEDDTSAVVVSRGASHPRV